MVAQTVDGEEILRAGGSTSYTCVEMAVQQLMTEIKKIHGTKLFPTTIKLHNIK